MWVTCGLPVGYMMVICGLHVGYMMVTCELPLTVLKKIKHFATECDYCNGCFFNKKATISKII